MGVEGLQILAFTRQLWLLSSDVSLACHIFCDTGLPFIMVISEEPRHSYAMHLTVELSLSVLTT